MAAVVLKARHALKAMAAMPRVKFSPPPLGSSVTWHGRGKASQFDPNATAETAVTLPSAYYCQESFARAEMLRTFASTWQAVGHVEQLEKPGDMFTGRIGNANYVVSRDSNGELKAFTDSLSLRDFQLDNNFPKEDSTFELTKNINELELVPLKCGRWGPLLLLHFEGGTKGLSNPPQNVREEAEIGVDWLGSPTCKILENVGACDSNLRHVARCEYTINCNWKVYCDNYLDGGYHVEYAHQGLAEGLDLPSYKTEIYDRNSVQFCRSKGSDSRLGEEATYAFIYPNFMINRYGPWMDTNTVLPLAPNWCSVLFDYFLPSEMANDKEFIKRSLADSHIVQEEDIELCERVQEGLHSPSYDIGRYAPKVETPMYRFHATLFKELQ